MLRGERVTYSMVGGNLQRQESQLDAQPVLLITSVQQAISGGVLQNQDFFQYLDAGGVLMTAATAAANPQLIRTIWVGKPERSRSR